MNFKDTLINRTVGSGNPAEARIASFILSDPEKASKMTIVALAEAANVSYITVCRMVSKLGFNGYPEFKIAVAGLNTPINETLYHETEDSFSISGKVIARICDLAVSVTENCRHAIDPDMLDKITNLCLSAKQIYFIGLGTSTVTAQYAYTKLFRLELPCAYDSDIMLMKMKISLMKPGDILFAVSSSGRTRAIMEAAKMAKSAGVTVIVLNDYKNSPLSRCADIAIATTARDQVDDSANDAPLIQGQLTIVDMIYTCLLQRLGKHEYIDSEQSL